MAKRDFLTRDQVREVYQKHAGVYDLAVYLYYLIGMRIGHWRRLAMEHHPDRGHTPLLLVRFPWCLAVSSNRSGFTSPVGLSAPASPTRAHC